jgi:UDP:flavonoid glycosyltransferase YjiC (YdhE family)
VISLSTTYMAQATAIGRCIDAVRPMPVRALVTVGPSMDPAAFRGGPNVAVVRSAPHEAVFPLASVVVTHAGMGTVTRALAHGVPLVCLPLGRDQHDVAARVRFHGAGLRVGAKAPAAKIRAAVERVLAEPSFRRGADTMRVAIESDLTAERAVAELEELAGRRP